ncbi:uncharacterized protein N7482_000805 [Penicillium canariense]|uniref:Uncharacterized protein n=1 Tax=Penicillium canariense TaxID=189055 RepID=A0A9W9IDZ5_9EURO|nr:uncharacterized protein N7482_000805 [Penicillium canariense]KAJ5174928.1 hypothetical protein N7482_000805 [Penicillium canariense]
MQGYYETVGPDWTGVETPYQTAFMGVNPSPYCTEPMVPHPAILTPISLPDSSFHPSPALGHHSQTQEYPPQEYRYSISDSVQPQGLGISAPFPSEYPRTTAPTTNYIYAPNDTQYGMGYTPSMSPSAPAHKRMKRTFILPHPEGIERMKHERSQSTPARMPRKPRAPGRGRRDPKAEEEDAFVEDLREQNVAWKMVRQLYSERFNKDASEARLQMRLLRRRKERLARWDDRDVQLLISASEMWEVEKYQFVAEKMKVMGSTKHYTPEQCKAQLCHLESKLRPQAQDSSSDSPSVISDPADSPTIPLSTSRKRARPESED